MKPVKFLLLLAMAFSLFVFSSCEEEKDDAEKHALVIVNHTYNRGSLQVTIENKNNEKVTVELLGRYSPSAMSTTPNYIQEKVQVEAHETIKREFPLSGDMPTNLDLTYKVY